MLLGVVTDADEFLCLPVCCLSDHPLCDYFLHAVTDRAYPTYSAALHCRADPPDDQPCDGDQPCDEPDEPDEPDPTCPDQW